MRVVGVAGCRGSGKSLAAKAARSLNIPVLEMSRPVVRLMRRRGLRVTNRSLRLFADRIRKERGRAVSAGLAIDEIRKMKGRRRAPVVLVNGVRSRAEVKEFRKHFTFKLIALTAPVRTRFRRILRRGRKDDPRTWARFLWSERMERRWGLAKAVASADHVVRNEGSKAEALGKLKGLLRKLKK